MSMILKACLAVGLTALLSFSSHASDSPWEAYNEGVESYAKQNYQAAFEKWQDLSLQDLPRSLKRHVWFQLGNAQYRLGEPLEKESPEETVELWRRSCAAYRVVLRDRPRDKEARYNLEFVLRKLARLTHQLGVEAYKASQNKPLDAAIDLLKTSNEHLEEAAALAPDDQQITRDRDQARQALRERLTERAQTSEQKGDESASQNNPAADQQAEDQYRAAIEDLSEVRRPPPTTEPNRENKSETVPDKLEQSATEAQERVSDKLADLLTRRGQREQQAGDQQANINPDQALEKYESALQDFQAAQEVKLEQTAAQKGEREVQESMEQLHLRQGQQELKRGKEALAQKNPQAAPALSAALSHFESAMELNEDNAEAQTGAEEARRLLPEALNLAGKNELQAGDRAEPRSATEALGHYQEAEQDFRQSLGLKPDQPPAQQGLQEAEQKLAQARERAAREAEAVAQNSQPPNQPPLTLQSLLGRVEEEKRIPAADRLGQRAQRGTAQRKYHADW